MINLKKIMAVAALSLVLAAGVGGIKTKAEDTNFNVTRVSGADRISTADQVAQKQFTAGSTTNVVLVNGYGYADAVSATPLAKQLQAPILLTAGGSTLESDVTATMDSLGVKNVYIVGGTGVISSSIETSLRSKYGSDNVQRIQGTTDTTRMGTNAAVAQKVIALSGDQNADKKAILVNGQDGYADALSASAIAAQKGYPVFLASKTQVSSAVKNVITSNGFTVLAVGGNAVLPDSVVNSVNGVSLRTLLGSDTLVPTDIKNMSDRYATNLAVLYYFSNSTNGGIDFSTVYIAAGGVKATDFADALVGSAAAAKQNAPLVLTGGTVGTSAVNARNYIISKNDSANIMIIGGTGVVTPQVEGLYDPFSIIGID